MFNISLPAFLRPRPAGAHNSSSNSCNNFTISLGSVPIHTIETDPSRPARSLKHLIKLNHANHAVLHNHLRFHNHLPHALGSAYAFGATSEHLNDFYEEEAKVLDPWSESPGELSLEDWKEFWGKKEYERAFLDFFEDQLVRLGYDWKQVLGEFLFDGKGGSRLVNGLISGLGHPLIHLGYAIEFDSKTLSVEALTLGSCVHEAWFAKYVDDAKYSKPPTAAGVGAGLDGPGKDVTPLELLHKVANDERFDGVYDAPGSAEFEPLLEEREEEVLEYWNAWQVTKGAKEQFKQSQRAAVAVLVASHDPSRTPKYDFFFCHILTTSHAVRILLGSKLFARWHGSLVRQWWLFTLATYVSQMRPAIREENIWNVDLNGRDWSWVTKTALSSKWNMDAHFVKACRAMKEAATTWGDDDGFYLRAAVKFAEDFDGWGGYGAMAEDEEGDGGRR